MPVSQKSLMIGSDSRQIVTRLKRARTCRSSRPSARRPAVDVDEQHHHQDSGARQAEHAPAGWCARCAAAAVPSRQPTIAAHAEARQRRPRQRQQQHADHDHRRNRGEHDRAGAHDLADRLAPAAAARRVDVHARDRVAHHRRRHHQQPRREMIAVHERAERAGAARLGLDQEQHRCAARRLSGSPPSTAASAPRNASARQNSRVLPPALNTARAIQKLSDAERDRAERDERGVGIDRQRRPRWRGRRRAASNCIAVAISSRAATARATIAAGRGMS